MSALAVLYDVHGNLPALEAVLADARAAGAERLLLGSDYALFGPHPAETVAALHGLEGATWIRGNVDRWCAHPDQAPEDEVLRRAVSDCRASLGDAAVQELGTLREQVVLYDTRYCHASPVSDMRSFMPDASGDERELLSGVAERRVLFGHTHLPFRRIGAGGIELINPGSVGFPFDGDTRAAYAIVHDDDSVEHRRVPYDHEASATAVVERFEGAPWAKRSAQWLRSARREG